MTIKEPPQVDIKDAMRVLDEYRQYMNLDINNAEFVYDGEVIEIDQADIAEWKFTGLGSLHFIELIIVPKYVESKS